MTQLDYGVPGPAPQPHPFFFWLLYYVVGAVSAYATDVGLHVATGRISDGGCFFIGLFSLPLFAVVVFVVRKLVGPRMRMWPWLGALAGLAAPPLALGMFIVVDRTF